MKISQNKPQGTRKIKQPRLRWLEDKENDLQKLKLKRWRQKANNGQE
jgi:hypothetical protein